MYKVTVFILISFRLLQAQHQTHHYDSFSRHTKTLRTVGSAEQIDSFEYDRVTAITRHVRFIEAPDLQVTSVAYNGVAHGATNPLALSVGTVGQLRIAHENRGSRTAGGFGIAVRWSPDPVWDNGNDIAVYDVPVGGLGVGASRQELNANFSLGSNVPLGNGYLLVYTDFGEAVVELDETNNLLVVPLFLCSAYSLAISGVNDYCGNSQGQASVLPNGGTAPYSYQWSQGGTAANVTGLAGSLGGTLYTVTTTDANGCTATETVAIGSRPALLVQPNVIGPAPCGQSTGFITLQPQGGQAPYRYDWSNNQTTTVGQLFQLTQGNYFVTVTDANNCTTIQNYTVLGSPPLTLSHTVQDALCGINSGSIQLQVSGGKEAPLSYQWNTGNAIPNLSNLAPGAYQVTVTDGTCRATQNIMVGSAPAPTLSLQAQRTNCTQQTGRIQSFVSSGTPPYTYQWNNGTTTDSLTQLGQGTYRLTVTDANNCTVTQSTTLIATNSLQVSSTTVRDSCQTGNGQMLTTITGGTGNYQYVWSGNVSQTGTALGLHAWTYSVTGTDAGAPPVCRVVHRDTVAGTPPCGGSTVLVLGGGGGGTVPRTAAGAVEQPERPSLAQGCEGILPAVQGVVLPFGESQCRFQVLPAPEAKRLPYRYQWNTGSTADTLLGTSDRPYFVKVTNALGCDTVLQFNCSPANLDRIAQTLSLTVFPSPNMGSQFSVELKDGTIESYAIYDAIGQQLGDAPIQIEAGDVAVLPHRIQVPGTYVFVFQVRWQGALYPLTQRVGKRSK